LRSPGESTHRRPAIDVVGYDVILGRYSLDVRGLGRRRILGRHCARQACIRCTHATRRRHGRLYSGAHVIRADRGRCAPQWRIPWASPTSIRLCNAPLRNSCTSP
jgi:hypothetical protein